MKTALWIRVVFAYLTFQSVQIGAWALLAPRSFYDDFPGPRSWVSVDGPYNEHLIRDVGSLNLALAVVFVMAAVTPERKLIWAASIAALAWGVPHLVYHVVNTDGLSGTDVAFSLGGLALFVALPIWALVMSRGRSEVQA